MPFENDFFDIHLIHALTFFRIHVNAKNNLRIVDKFHIFTHKEPPNNFKLIGSLPACQAYCIFVHILAISDEDVAYTLREWENDLIVVCHDNVVVMPDLFGTHVNEYSLCTIKQLVVNGS